MIKTQKKDHITIDMLKGEVTEESDDGRNVFKMGSAKAFEVLSRAWLRGGWDVKHVYTFTWLGRPIIQLPEDMFRIQEVIYQLKPDCIIETGVAHGGSLIFYASLLKVIGKGRVVGVEYDLREHNREAIRNHPLFQEYISLIDGDSIDREVIEKVRQFLRPKEKVMVLLDSNHSRDHVYRELELYSEFVTRGSYLVAMDGIMKDLAGAPRSGQDWCDNNPHTAILNFLESHPEFKEEEPAWLFDESEGLSKNVTYWPNAWLKKL